VCVYIDLQANNFNVNKHRWDTCCFLAGLTVHWHKYTCWHAYRLQSTWYWYCIHGNCCLIDMLFSLMRISWCLWGFSLELVVSFY